MIILAVDPSYSSFGIVLFDTIHKHIISNSTIKLPSLSALSKKYIEIMEEGFGYKDINNKVEKQDYWNNIKLRIFYDNVKELIRRYNVDVVLSESQFSSISDVFAVVRLVSTCNDKACKFKAYKPTSWHKILFGYGGLNRDQSKQFTKEKIDSNFGDKFNLKTQDEYDAFALILTYVKEKGIISDINFNDFLIDKDLIKRRGK